jgi:hypothetical protein
MDKLFEAVQEGHDSKNRIVFICKDANGFYVLKPATGFKSKHYPAQDDAELLQCYERVCGCGHTHAFYEDSERPAEGEKYSTEKTVKELTPEQVIANEAKAKAKAEKAAAKAAAKPATKKAVKK